MEWLIALGGYVGSLLVALALDALACRLMFGKRWQRFVSTRDAQLLILSATLGYWVVLFVVLVARLP